MNAFLAIVGDTWRQSKQQWVFFVLAGMLFLTALFFVGAFRVKPTPSGDQVLHFPFGADTADAGLELLWDQQYRALVHDELKHEEQLKVPREEAKKLLLDLQLASERVEELEKNQGSAEDLSAAQAKVLALGKQVEEQRDELRKLQTEQIDAAQALVDERAKGLSSLHKGVEVWMGWASLWLFTFSMWLFIAACAGYYPNTLASGAVDVLLSKPITRAQLFFGKFLGGLVLFSALLLAIYVIVFVGVGIRTGVWHPRFFAGVPLTVFSAALLFAIVGWIGVFTRSTAFAIIVGYAFYLIIDSIIGGIQAFGDAPTLDGRSGLAETLDVLRNIGNTAQLLFPGFGRLKDAAQAATLNVPILDAQPLLVALAWLGICLGTAYWRFHRQDF